MYISRLLLTLYTLLCAVSWLLVPLTVSAASCCNCTVSDTSVCLQDPPDGDCSALASGSNADLKGANCAPLDASQCKPIAEKGVCKSGPTAAATYKKSTTNNISGKFEIISPKLNVPIPGLDFGPNRSYDIASKNASSTDGTKSIGKKVEINFLGQYIAAIYKYLLGISIVTASVMIVYGGFLYVLGATTPKINTGKEIIQNTIIGIVILFSSYTILNTINPLLVELKPLGIIVVEPGPPFERERQIASNAVSMEGCEKNRNASPSAISMSGSGAATAEIREAAMAIQQETGVPAILLLGVMSVESSFSDKACPNNNCSGIKCYKTPAGKGWVNIGEPLECGSGCALLKTNEDFHDGRGQIAVLACFQKFPDVPKEEKWKSRFRHTARILLQKNFDRPDFSWRDYVGNPDCLAKYMQKSGYATATNYHDVMVKNFKSYNLLP